MAKTPFWLSNQPNYESNVTDGQDVVIQLEGKIDYKQLKELSDAVKNAKTHIGRLRCEYCGEEILSVVDKWNSSQWWGYLGNQATRPNIYQYSPIIRVLRLLDGRKMNENWSENKLYNVHARIHSKPVKDYSIICKPNSLHMLWAHVFSVTYVFKV